MEKDSVEWLVYADTELKKTYPDAQSGARVDFEGGKFIYSGMTKFWKFQGWLDGFDPTKTIVDTTK